MIRLGILSVLVVFLSGCTTTVEVVPYSYSAVRTAAQELEQSINSRFVSISPSEDGSGQVIRRASPIAHLWSAESAELVSGQSFELRIKEGMARKVGQDLTTISILRRDASSSYMRVRSITYSTDLFGADRHHRREAVRREEMLELLREH